VTELERTLIALGLEIEVSAAPDLAPAVLALIEPQPTPRPRRRWAVVVAFAVLATLAATFAIPEARSALLRILHIGAERIELVDELPEVAVQHDLEFVFGERVELEEARRRASFDLRELDEDPDRVYLGDRGTVWFLYGTPEHVRLLVAQTPRLRLDAPLVLKKLAGPQTRIAEVAVDGSQGFFLDGEPHLVLLVDENGQVVEESARLSRDVLVWESAGVTYRLEGDFAKDDALRLARSLG